jgi:DNA repair protein RadA/Sms
VAKAKTSFFCQSCGHSTPKWLGKCPSCEEWNTFVEELIETKVRPAIEADGGMITFCAFEEGVVYIKLQGACSSCPHSQETLK